MAKMSKEKSPMTGKEYWDLVEKTAKKAAYRTKWKKARSINVYRADFIQEKSMKQAKQE